MKSLTIVSIISAVAMSMLMAGTAFGQQMLPPGWSQQSAAAGTASAAQDRGARGARDG
jgi:hypothetical protein